LGGVFGIENDKIGDLVLVWSAHDRVRKRKGLNSTMTMLTSIFAQQSAFETLERGQNHICVSPQARLQRKA
jgi:hypothetical protein